MRKHEKKRDLREIKAKYAPFEKIRIDGNYLEQTLALHLKRGEPQKGLPLYQYTARDIKTGALFVSLAYEHTRINSAIFVDRVLSHLARFGVVPAAIQTDNGTEFVHTRDASQETLFTHIVERSGITRHLRIPPGAKTWQSDVESSHWIIEREFYDVVKASSDHNMVDKLRAYQWGFNIKRKNGYKGNKTPLEIIKEDPRKRYSNLNQGILDFPTCILDEKLLAFLKDGHHVALPTRFWVLGVGC